MEAGIFKFHARAFFVRSFRTFLIAEIKKLGNWDGSRRSQILRAILCNLFNQLFYTENKISRQTLTFLTRTSPRMKTRVIWYMMLRIIMHCGNPRNSMNDDRSHKTDNKNIHAKCFFIRFPRVFKGYLLDGLLFLTLNWVFENTEEICLTSAKNWQKKDKFYWKFYDMGRKNEYMKGHTVYLWYITYDL